MQEIAMRKLLVTVQMSLDGVMQAPGGPEEDPTGGFKHGGWTVNYWDDTTMNAMGGVFAQPKRHDGQRCGRPIHVAAAPQRA